MHGINVYPNITILVNNTYHILSSLKDERVPALAIAADTGHVAKACRRMSVKRGPQGNALKKLKA